MATLKNTIFNDTGFIELPAGTTAQRPSEPVTGMMRLNTDFASIEYYADSQWITAKYGKPANLSVNGGVSTVDNDGWRIHSFTSSGSITVNTAGFIEYLLVAGGGSGGENVSTNNRGGGGGGAGGLRTGFLYLQEGTYPIVVGAGGSRTNGAGNNGTGSGLGDLVSVVGGGGGGGANTNSFDEIGKGGGSAGGAGQHNGYPQTGIQGQGRRGGADDGTFAGGGAGGGGGGATAAGSNASGFGLSPGGQGFVSDITGSAVEYARGGDCLTGSSGGTDGVPPPANTGQGGEGVEAGIASAGASGIVIIRYTT